MVLILHYMYLGLDLLYVDLQLALLALKFSRAEHVVGLPHGLEPCKIVLHKNIYNSSC